MCKKLLIAGAAVVVGLVLLRVTTVGSLLHVWWNDASRFVERQVPPETRLKQLQLEVNKIDTDIKGAVKNLVRLEVERDDLVKSIDFLKAKQDKSKKDMRALVEGLEQGNTLVSVGSQTLSSEVAQIRLDGLRNEYEIRKETLRNKEDLLKSKQDALVLADQRISKIQEKKAELTALVASMEAKLEQLRVRQINNNIEINDSQVSKCEALADSLRKELAEQEKIAEKFARYGIDATEPSAPVKTSNSKAESIKAAKALLADDVAGSK
jgi:chromosome segregation ATPase